MLQEFGFGELVLVMRWLESFETCFMRAASVSYVSLSYGENMTTDRGYTALSLTENEF